MKQHRVTTLYQDRDELIKKPVSLASPELTVILLYQGRSGGDKL